MLLYCKRKGECSVGLKGLIPPSRAALRILLVLTSLLIIHVSTRGVEYYCRGIIASYILLGSKVEDDLGILVLDTGML